MIKYCIQIVNGLYNVTGNESCYSYKTLPTCHFLFTHWFGQNPSPVHTLLIIIENEVTKQVKPVAINMYHGKSYYFHSCYISVEPEEHVI